MTYPQTSLTIEDPAVLRELASFVYKAFIIRNQYMNLITLPHISSLTLKCALGNSVGSIFIIKDVFSFFFRVHCSSTRSCDLSPWFSPIPVQGTRDQIYRIRKCCQTLIYRQTPCRSYAVLFITITSF